jgi:hypothetical protein
MMGGLVIIKSRKYSEMFLSWIFYATPHVERQLRRMNIWKLYLNKICAMKGDKQWESNHKISSL